MNTAIRVAVTLIFLGLAFAPLHFVAHAAGPSAVQRRMSSGPPIPASAELGSPIAPKRMSEAQAIAVARHHSDALPSWFRHRATVTFGSWREYIPVTGKYRIVDVWRIVFRNVFIPYRDCGGLGVNPIHKVTHCTTYHNVAILVLDGSTRGAVFYWF